MRLAEKIQEADWKKEKHVPVIDCPDAVEADTWTKVTVSLGKAVDHPNTTEHHIRWIAVFFCPDDEKFAYEIGRFEFNAHGESTEGPNNGPVHTHHEVTFSFKTQKPGNINALALCNIHGLWESDKRIDLK